MFFGYQAELIYRSCYLYTDSATLAPQRGVAALSAFLPAGRPRGIGKIEQSFTSNPCATASLREIVDFFTASRQAFHGSSGWRHFPKFARDPGDYADARLPQPAPAHLGDLPGWIPVQFQARPLTLFPPYFLGHIDAFAPLSLDRRGCQA